MPASAVPVDLLEVPYSLGRQETGSGLGPKRLLEAGLPGMLDDRGHQTRIVAVRRIGAFAHEIGAAFDVSRVLAEHVRASLRAGRFPLVLAGDCSACLGTLAGMGSGPTGIVWFDAHADFNTPETTITGFLGGMPLAAAVGRCWTSLCATIPGFRPVRESSVVLCGARALDPKEADLLAASKVLLVDGPRVRESGIRRALLPALEALAAQVNGVYVHLDLDVLDPALTPANVYREPGGLTADDVIAALDLIAARLFIRAGAITAYDPAFDEGGRTSAAGVRIAGALAEAAEAASTH